MMNCGGQICLEREIDTLNTEKEIGDKYEDGFW